MATTVLLLAISPMAGAEDEATATWRCAPSTDGGATTIQIGSATYYHKLYSNSGYYVEELWQESNTEGGLQSSPGMSCLGKSDKLLRQVCVGLCPLTF